MVWTNSPSLVYHGTIEAHANDIVVNNVDPSKGRITADFGQGFYVTTDLHQAQQWANSRARSIPSGPNAAVVALTLDRDLAARYGDHITFLLADNDYFDFVAFNRFGSAYHGRSARRVYDIVYGPLAAFPSTMTYANCGQICFVAGGNAHSALSAPTIGDVTLGNPYFP